MCQASEETRMRRLQMSSKPETFAVVSVWKGNRLSERVWGNVETNNLSTDFSDFLIPLQWNRIFGLGCKQFSCTTEAPEVLALDFCTQPQPTGQTQTALFKWASWVIRTYRLTGVWVVSEPSAPETALPSLLLPVHCQAQGCSCYMRSYPFIKLKLKPIGLCN